MYIHVYTYTLYDRFFLFQFFFFIADLQQLPSSPWRCEFLRSRQLWAIPPPVWACVTAQPHICVMESASLAVAACLLLWGPEIKTTKSTLFKNQILTLLFSFRWVKSLNVSGSAVKMLREHYLVNTMFFGRMLRRLLFLLILLNKVESFCSVCLDVTSDCFSISAPALVCIHFDRLHPF